MSEIEIQGRNLIKDGRFPATWKSNWRHDGVGNAVSFGDPVFGNYLTMNMKAGVSQAFNTAIFTEEQLKGASYRVSFQYENYGEGDNAGVEIETGSGKKDFIDLSGKKTRQPLADWNLYPSYGIRDVVAADENIALKLQGSDLGSSSGLRMTDIRVDLHLVPLKLTGLKVDGRHYEVPA
ncbi:MULTISPECIES: hypothetical protein [unclassified Pseudomonas]|uniref:hypothetical protein n=1 Tax=unclassified Pseudomonas TaxID=196821 RepID=UPI001CC0D837|nr:MULTISPECIES: hypothetical protein [unclassified Pseudomonas]